MFPQKCILFLVTLSTFLFSADTTITLQKGLDGYNNVYDTYLEFQKSDSNYGVTDSLYVKCCPN